MAEPVAMCECAEVIRELTRERDQLQAALEALKEAGAHVVAIANRHGHMTNIPAPIWSAVEILAAMLDKSARMEEDNMVNLLMPLRADLVHDRMVIHWLDAMTTAELADLTGRIQAVMHAKGLMGAEHAGRLQALLEAQANG